MAVVRNWHYEAWQYNGVDKMSTILAWCYKCLDVDDWHYNDYETILFYNRPAYTMFMLRWGG